MSYFERDYYDYGPKRPSFLGLFLAALFGALLGGMLILAVGPDLLTGRKPPEQQLPWQQDGQDLRTPRLDWDPTASPVVVIAEQVGPTVVGITTIKSGRAIQGASSSGSGVIIDGRNGYIVTNYHVVEGAREIRVRLDDDSQYVATLVGYDWQTDLAVLRINATNLPEARLGDSNQLKVGELAVAIGNPLGLDFARSVTSGVISALNREITVTSAGTEVTLRVIQTDAAINPGNSGGALVNGQGEVIGINSVKIARAGVEGMGFAIPISDARPVIEQLISQGFVRRPFLGIFNFEEVTPQIAQWYRLPEGLYVGGVVQGGPAAQAGMRVEDVIVSLGGREIKTMRDFHTALNAHQVGDEVKVVVIRDGRRVELTVKLGEAPRG